jgi:hypothetical protein
MQLHILCSAVLIVKNARIVERARKKLALRYCKFTVDCSNTNWSLAFYRERHHYITHWIVGNTQAVYKLKCPHYLRWYKVYDLKWLHLCRIFYPVLYLNPWSHTIFFVVCVRMRARTCINAHTHDERGASARRCCYLLWWNLSNLPG